MTKPNQEPNQETNNKKTERNKRKKAKYRKKKKLQRQNKPTKRPFLKTCTKCRWTWRVQKTPLLTLNQKRKLFKLQNFILSKKITWPSSTIYKHNFLSPPSKTRNQPSNPQPNLTPLHLLYSKLKILSQHYNKKTTNFNFASLLYKHLKKWNTKTEKQNLSRFQETRDTLCRNG